MKKLGKSPTSSKNVDSYDIPIPKEILEEYSSFFGKSKDQEVYNFIKNLDLYDPESIWTTRSMDNEVKPVGMKTLDFYFNKKGSLKHEKLEIKSKKLSNSPVKTYDGSISKNKSPKNSNMLSKEPHSVETSCLDSNEAENTSADDLVPCSQNSPFKSKFNLSAPNKNELKTTSSYLNNNAEDSDSDSSNLTDNNSKLQSKISTTIEANGNLYSKKNFSDSKIESSTCGQLKKRKRTSSERSFGSPVKKTKADSVKDISDSNSESGIDASENDKSYQRESQKKKNINLESCEVDSDKNYSRSLFKNKDISKMLGLQTGLNVVNRNINRSSLGNVEKSLKTYSRKSLNVSKKLSNASNSSFSEDDSSKSNKQNNETLFLPKASSSFMKINLNPNDILTPDSTGKSQNKSNHSVSETDSDDTSDNEPQNNERLSKENKSKHRTNSDSENVSIDKISRSKETIKNVDKSNHSVSDTDSSDSASNKKENNESLCKSILKKNDSKDETSSESESLSSDTLPWLRKIKSSMNLVNASDKLNVADAFCHEDIESGDEIYTLQCPKEINVESLVGKKISLTGESVFEILLNTNKTVSYESFAMKASSKINLLLPSKKLNNFKLGSYNVEGSIVLSESCQVPEIDESSFISTFGESSSSDDDNIVSSLKKKKHSTPLPTGLRKRHPLYGLDYDKIPDLDISCALSKHKKKSKKKPSKEKTTDFNCEEEENEFKKPSSKSKTKKNKSGVIIAKNHISLDSDDESNLKNIQSESVRSKHPILEETPVTSHSKKEKKKKKKSYLENAEKEKDALIKSSDYEVDTVQVTKKKKKNKDKDTFIEPVIKETLVDEEEEIVKSKKKKKKDKVKD